MILMNLKNNRADGTLKGCRLLFFLTEANKHKQK